MTQKITATSEVRVRTLIDANAALGTQTVQMAILAPDVLPVAGDWKTAGWDGDVAFAIIGPGHSITLAANRSYVVWVKITDSPEIVELRAGGISTY